MEEIMIQIKNVSKNYGKKNVIKDMTLEIPDGVICSFIGPNGSGKTTTINMITGITEITEGDIFINGKSITKESVEAKKNFGLVPDSPDMFLNTKVTNYFKLITSIYEIEDAKENIEKLSKRFKIEKYLNSKISELSHGTRQKVFIIGALIHNPSVWILDEPMTGLDPASALELKKMMKEHAKEKNTVFFSTHVLEVAEKLADIFIIINEGKIIYQGDYKTLQKEYGNELSLEDLFIKITGKSYEEVN